MLEACGAQELRLEPKQPIDRRGADLRARVQKRPFGERA